MSDEFAPGPAPDSPAQPTPTQWVYGHAAMPDGNKLVIIDLHTVVGLVRIFLDPDAAIDIAAKLKECAEQAKAPAIFRPANVLIGPNGQPIVFQNPIPAAPAPGAPVGPAQEQIDEEKLLDEDMDYGPGSEAARG